MIRNALWIVVMFVVTVLAVKAGQPDREHPPMWEYTICQIGDLMCVAAEGREEWEAVSVYRDDRNDPMVLMKRRFRR